ncbi:MAG: preprotein translocase subunit SecE [Patescibacteria group bacterium]
MFNRVKSYILESYSELKRVNWPTKDETIRMTLVVIAMSLIMAVFLGSLDFLFRYLLKIFII